MYKYEKKNRRKSPPKIEFDIFQIKNCDDHFLSW